MIFNIILHIIIFKINGLKNKISFINFNVFKNKIKNKIYGYLNTISMNLLRLKFFAYLLK